MYMVPLHDIIIILKLQVYTLTNYRVITYELKQRSQGDPLKLSSISSRLNLYSKFQASPSKWTVRYALLKYLVMQTFLRIQTKDINLQSILETKFTKTNKNWVKCWILQVIHSESDTRNGMLYTSQSIWPFNFEFL